MKKKLVAGAVTLLSVVTLAACANGTNKDIVTMKGDTITVSDFYNEIKTNQGAQQVLFQMTINKVFEKEYGSKVSDKEVDKELAKQKKQLGNQFDAYLAQQGLTEETAKKQIRSNMLLEYAVNQAAKKDIKESDYKAAFESYTPEVTAQIIKLDSEDKAKEVVEQGYLNKTVTMGIRPENIYDPKELVEVKKGAELNVKINVYELLGSEVYLYFDLENFPMTARVNADTTARMGDKVKFIMDMEKVHIFDKETGIVITN